MRNTIFAIFIFGVCLSYTPAQLSVDSRWILKTQSADFSLRFGSATVLFKNRLWVIGGSPYSGPATQDIWSTADGKTWDRITDAAPCLPRQGHTALVFNGKLWVIAGATPKNGPVFYSRSDVWNTSDGVTWDKVTDSSAFTPRVWHASTVFDGKMWVLGGQDTRKLAVALGDAYYSVDGVSWTLASPKAFSPRSFPKAVVFQNKMWVLGGFGSELLKDILSSSDGITWTMASGLTGYNPTNHLFTATTYNGKVWLADEQKLLNTSDMIHWNTVTGQGPLARLGLLEMGPNLLAIGTYNQGPSYTSPVYSYTELPGGLPKRVSK